MMKLSKQGKTDIDRLSSTSLTTILRETEEKRDVQMALSGAMYGVANMYSDCDIKALTATMDAFYKEFQYEPLSVFIDVINDFRTGKIRVFGRITPNQIREAIIDKLDKIARERENAHIDRKGDAGDRSTLTLREALAKVTTQK
tara:strand:- start:167 stop:598 length:432 start_codon:yes stop_codon:yes gene_type:complete